MFFAIGMKARRWVRELDYLYLGLGGLGAMIALKRLSVISDNPNVSDVYGPLIIVTAIVIRAIKTRVEINKWNKT